MEKIARIIRIIRDNIWISIDGKEHQVNIKGTIRQSNIKPCVGDMVDIEWEHNTPIITNIKQRKSILIRPKVANIDMLVIVQSTTTPNFDTFLLDQMICYYEYHHIDVVIALTKSDIFMSNEIAQFKQDYQKMGYKIFDINKNDEYEELLKLFKNKLICFAGNSGVGKSTLINKIDNTKNIKTQDVSKHLNRGKHTTTTTSILSVHDFYIVDTPGYSTIKLEMTKIELAHSFFHKILESKYCKFNDCFHTINSHGCEILNLLNTAYLVKWRYNNYLKILEGLDYKYDKTRFK